MLGKLIKYEMKSCIRTMTIVWVGMLAASLLLSLISNALTDSLAASSIYFSMSDMLSLLQALGGFLYVAMFVALIVVTTIVIIMRFYKGLLGDEGYLMHTLPVKAWQLITSKGIVACIIVIVSILDLIVSIVLLGGISNLSALADFPRDVYLIIKENPENGLYLLEGLVLVLCCIIQYIYQVYASLSIGQLFGKYRKLISFAVYMGISILVSTILTRLTILTENDNFINLINVASGYDANNAVHLVMWALIVIELVQIVVFHIIAERLLSTKLNLQ